MKATRLIVILSLFLSSSAMAQMGRHRPTTPGNGFGMGMMDLIVAPDGTAIVQQAPAAATLPALQSRLIAVTPSGSTAWSWNSEEPIQFVTIAEALVLVSTGDDEGGDLVALSLSTGRPAWTLPLRGMAMAVASSPQQIYAVVTSPSYSGQPGGMGPMWNGGRTLVAISYSGVPLWSKSLD